MSLGVQPNERGSSGSPGEAEVDPPGANDGDRSSSRRVIVLTIILIFPTLVAAAYFATRILAPKMLGLAVPTLPASNITIGNTETFTNSLNQTGSQAGGLELFPGVNLTSLASNLPKISLAEVLIVFLAVIVGLVLIRGVHQRRMRTTPFEGRGEETDILASRRQSVAAALDTAISRIQAGSAPKEAVIQCYKLIEKLLQERSDVDGRALTPREFRDRISERLKIDSPYLAQVTSLFELARYSDREITEEQAREAATCLSNLSALLKGQTVQVSDIRR